MINYKIIKHKCHVMSSINFSYKKNCVIKHYSWDNITLKKKTDTIVDTIKSRLFSGRNKRRFYSLWAIRNNLGSTMKNNDILLYLYLLWSCVIIFIVESCTHMVNLIPTRVFTFFESAKATVIKSKLCIRCMSIHLYRW